MAFLEIGLRAEDGFEIGTTTFLHHLKHNFVLPSPPAYSFSLFFPIFASNFISLLHLSLSLSLSLYSLSLYSFISLFHIIFCCEVTMTTTVPIDSLNQIDTVMDQSDSEFMKLLLETYTDVNWEGLGEESALAGRGKSKILLVLPSIVPAH